MITCPSTLYNCTTYATIAPTMNGLSLLLASRSPRRRELVALLGLPFDVTTADVPEDPLADESPAQVVTRLSQAKACANSNATVVAAIIVACDTVVGLDGEILGKPRDGIEATEMLRRLRGRAHAVYSAVTLLEPGTGRTRTEVAKTQLVMRTYTDAEMAAYVASGDPLDKAGAYAIQHPGFHPVASLRGCYANVVGLPLCHLTRGLRSLGVEPPHDVPTACQAHTGRRCLVYGAILGCDETTNGVSGE
jgi:septum formation protein